MKEQYVGDISDYRKYALLRALAAGGTNRIGVCWMLTLSDGSTDGNKLAYLSQPENHRAFDPTLFDILAHAAAEPGRRHLQTIEENGAIPGARYFNSPLSDDAAERRAYIDSCLAAFADTDLVFFDPDNGLEIPSRRVGRKNSSKYVYLDEVRAFYEAGQSVLIYQHFPRVEREAFVTVCAERLRTVAPDSALWAFRTKHVVFLLIIHPSATATLVEATSAAASQWDPSFLAGTKIAGSKTSPDETSSSEAELHPLATDTQVPASRKMERQAEGASELNDDVVEISSPNAERPSLLRRILRRLG